MTTLSFKQTFWAYVNNKNIRELIDFAEAFLNLEHLDQKQFHALIDTYVYREQEPLRDDVFKCLNNRPSVIQTRSISERIIAKMKEFGVCAEDGGLVK